MKKTIFSPKFLPGYSEYSDHPLVLFFVHIALLNMLLFQSDSLTSLLCQIPVVSLFRGAGSVFNFFSFLFKVYVNQWRMDIRGLAVVVLSGNVSAGVRGRVVHVWRVVENVLNIHLFTFALQRRLHSSRSLSPVWYGTVWFTSTVTNSNGQFHLNHVLL